VRLPFQVQFVAVYIPHAVFIDFCDVCALNILTLLILCNWDILILFTENELMLCNVD
jgi:hypothetical protein